MHLGTLAYLISQCILRGRWARRFCRYISGGQLCRLVAARGCVAVDGFRRLCRSRARCCSIGCGSCLVGRGCGSRAVGIHLVTRGAGRPGFRSCRPGGCLCGRRVGRTGFLCTGGCRTCLRGRCAACRCALRITAASRRDTFRLARSLGHALGLAHLVGLAGTLGFGSRALHDLRAAVQIFGTRPLALAFLLQALLLGTSFGHALRHLLEATRPDVGHQRPEGQRRCGIPARLGRRPGCAQLFQHRFSGGNRRAGAQRGFGLHAM